MTDKTEEGSSCLPVRFWGLNPLFWSHMKMFVKEVQSLEDYSDYKGIEYFPLCWTHTLLLGADQKTAGNKGYSPFVLYSLLSSWVLLGSELQNSRICIVKSNQINMLSSPFHVIVHFQRIFIPNPRKVIENSEWGGGGEVSKVKI